MREGERQADVNTGLGKFENIENRFELVGLASAPEGSACPISGKSVFDECVDRVSS